jgi:hypothetical protein
VNRRRGQLIDRRGAAAGRVAVAAGQGHPADDRDQQNLPDDEGGGHAHGAPHAAGRRNRFHIDGLYGKRSIEARFNAR